MVPSYILACSCWGTFKERRKRKQIGHKAPCCLSVCPPLGCCLSPYSAAIRVGGGRSDCGSKAWQCTTETGNNNLHIGAWWPSTLPGAGDNSQGMVNHTNSWENYLMSFQICWPVLLHVPGKRCGDAAGWQPCRTPQEIFSVRWILACGRWRIWVYINSL